MLPPLHTIHTHLIWPLDCAKWRHEIWIFHKELPLESWASLMIGRRRAHKSQFFSQTVESLDRYLLFFSLSSLLKPNFRRKKNDVRKIPEEKISDTVLFTFLFSGYKVTVQCNVSPSELQDVPLVLTIGQFLMLIWEKVLSLSLFAGAYRLNHFFKVNEKFRLGKKSLSLSKKCPYFYEKTLAIHLQDLPRVHWSEKRMWVHLREWYD